MQGRHARGTVLVAGVLLTLAWPAAAGEERYKWWQSETVKAEVGLTAEQSRDLEAIFQAMLPRMKAEKEELDREEQALSRLVSEAAVEESLVVERIERVEAMRAKASKTRTLMLYRMFRTLTPEQRRKLEAVHERLKAQHGSRRDRPPARQE